MGDGVERSRQGLGPERRLRKASGFRRVFEEALPASSGELVVYAIERHDEATPRLGLAVGRKVGNAAVRNLVKRRLRAAFRAEASRLAPVDIVVVARAGAVDLAFEDLRDMFIRLIGESLDRASKVADLRKTSADNGSERR